MYHYHILSGPENREVKYSTCITITFYLALKIEKSNTVHVSLSHSIWPWKLRSQIQYMYHYHILSGPENWEVKYSTCITITFYLALKIEKSNTVHVSLSHSIWPWKLRSQIQYMYHYHILSGPENISQIQYMYHYHILSGSENIKVKYCITITFNLALKLEAPRSL